MSDHEEVNVDDIAEENNNKTDVTECEKESALTTKPTLGIFSMESLIKPSNKNSSAANSAAPAFYNPLFPPFIRRYRLQTSQKLQTNQTQQFSMSKCSQLCQLWFITIRRTTRLGNVSHQLK